MLGKVSATIAAWQREIGRIAAEVETVKTDQEIGQTAGEGDTEGTAAEMELEWD